MTPEDVDLPSTAALKIIAAAVRYRSFSAAGKALGISHSAVGQTIARAEQLIGTPLFRRHRDGIDATDAAADLSAIYSRLAASYRQVLGRVSGHDQRYGLVIAAPATVVDGLGPHLIGRVMDEAVLRRFETAGPEGETRLDDYDLYVSETHFRPGPSHVCTASILEEVAVYLPPDQIGLANNRHELFAPSAWSLPVVHDALERLGFDLSRFVETPTPAVALAAAMARGGGVIAASFMARTPALGRLQPHPDSALLSGRVYHLYERTGSFESVPIAAVRQAFVEALGAPQKPQG